MQTFLLRFFAVAGVAIALACTVAGCDGDNVEVTGIGASVGLPGETMTGSDEIGVGNVQWVGNPRW